MKPLAARFIISSRGKRACFPRASQRQRDFLLSGLVSVRLDVILSSGVNVHPGSPGNRLPSMTSADSTDMFYSWRADGVFSSANYNSVSLRKQPTFGDATTGFLTKWRLRNECWNSILTMRHYPDLGNASDLIGRAASQIYFNQPASSVWNFCARTTAIHSLLLTHFTNNYYTYTNNYYT